MIPGIKLKPGQPRPTREEAAAFHESEANCNQCRHLKRAPHEKDRHGFLYGHCGANPFGQMFVMKFHPDDPMHMKCWEARS